MKTPKDTLAAKTTPSAVVQRPEVQKESVHTTEASHQKMSVDGATLPPNLTHGQPHTQPDTDVSAPKVFPEYCNII